MGATEPLDTLVGIIRNEQVSGSSPLIGSTKNALYDAVKADYEAFLI